MLSNAMDPKLAIKSGRLELMGIAGQDENADDGQGSLALKAAKHACKVLRHTIKKIEKQLRSFGTLKKQYSARATVAVQEDDQHVEKWQLEKTQVEGFVTKLEQFTGDAEAIALFVDELAKDGPLEDDGPDAVKNFEEKCEKRAKQCEEWRLAGEVHVQGGAHKITEMQSQLLRDPAEW